MSEHQPWFVALVALESYGIDRDALPGDASLWLALEGLPVDFDAVCPGEPCKRGTLPVWAIREAQTSRWSDEQWKEEAA